jgi:lipoate-protein ligase A
MIATFTKLYSSTRGEVTPDEYAMAEQIVTEKFATESWLYGVP